MREQKEFSTVLFGFDKKSVLEYIYEQDKEARAALTDLAERNTALEDSANQLKAALDAMSEQYDALREESKSSAETAEKSQKDCAALKDRLGKLSAQYHEKENSLQLQMEINKKMQQRINEQEATIDSLRKELETAKKRWKLFGGKKEDYTALHAKLDGFKTEFAEKMAHFEKEIAAMEQDAELLSAPFQKKEETQEEKKPAVHRVSPRIRTDRTGESGENLFGAASRNKLKSILNDWK